MIDGMLRAILRRSTIAPEPLPPGVSLRLGTFIPVIGGWLSGMRRPAAAVTIGRTIIVHPDTCVTSALLRHELAHVEQWQRFPFTFPVRYVSRHLRHGYRDNPYEIDARNAEHR
jgi:hypothetical protein